MERGKERRKEGGREREGGLVFGSISLQMCSIYLIQDEDQGELLLLFSNLKKVFSHEWFCDLYKQRAGGKPQNLLVISVGALSNPLPFQEVSVEKYV